MKIEVKPYYEYRYLSDFEKLFFHYDSDKPISRTLKHYEIYQNGKRAFKGRKFYTFEDVYGEDFKIFINENEIDYDICKNVKIYDIEKENTFEVLEDGIRIFKYKNLERILDIKNMIFKEKERKWLFSSEQNYEKEFTDIEDIKIQLVGLRRNEAIIDKSLEELEKEYENLMKESEKVFERRRKFRE